MLHAPTAWAERAVLVDRLVQPMKTRCNRRRSKSPLPRHGGRGFKGTAPRDRHSPTGLLAIVRPQQKRALHRHLNPSPRPASLKLAIGSRNNVGDSYRTLFFFSRQFTIFECHFLCLPIYAHGSGPSSIIISTASSLPVGTDCFFSRRPSIARAPRG